MSGLGAAQWRGTFALAGREVRRVGSLWTQTILPPIVTGAIFLAVFGGALASRVGRVEGVSYLDFILPGLLVTTVASQTVANSATSLFQAKSEGYIEDILTSPLRPSQIVGPFVAGACVRGLAAALGVGAVALPFIGVVHDPAVVVVALVTAALIFSAIGVITGVWAETFDQHSFVASIVITPLALLGGVFYPAASLDEPWSTLTRLDPVYYLVDATRAGLTGTHESAVWLSLFVAALLAVALWLLAVGIVARGWRLKP